MRQGDRIKCPLCGEETVVKSKPEMDGFTVTGHVLCCALCNGRLEEPAGESVAADVDADAAAAKRAAGAFAALLGAEDSGPDPLAVLTLQEPVRFCRSCRHFIEHPFKTLCGLNGAAADPMGECGRYAACEKEQG